MHIIFLSLLNITNGSLKNARLRVSKTLYVQREFVIALAEYRIETLYLGVK